MFCHCWRVIANNKQNRGIAVMTKLNMGKLWLIYNIILNIFIVISRKIYEIIVNNCDKAWIVHNKSKDSHECQRIS